MILEFFHTIRKIQKISIKFPANYPTNPIQSPLKSEKITSTVDRLQTKKDGATCPHVQSPPAAAHAQLEKYFCSSREEKKNNFGREAGKKKLLRKKIIVKLRKAINWT